MVENTSNPCLWDVEAEGSEVQGHHSYIRFLKKKIVFFFFLITYEQSIVAQTRSLSS